VRICYSWQSDTPRDIGKTFIREALRLAVESLEIDDAERPDIDQDTAGVLGSPVIADTIFGKIRDAKVIVADVTLTGVRPGGKRLINSNVALEVGYAIGVHGDGVLLKVMNTHYGPPEELPFDLAHRRWPVRFNLAPKAPAEKREKALRRLAAELTVILKEYIAASRPRPEPFLPTGATVNRAWYWNPDQPLIRRESQTFTYTSGQPLIYLHIWPHEKIPPLKIEVLSDYSKSDIEPLCGTSSGWSHERNRYGEITFAFFADRALISTTQVFRTGEIWGINHRLLREREHYPGKFLPMPALEQSLTQSLSKYIAAGINHFGYGREIDLRFGLVNVAGFVLLDTNGTPTRKIFEDFELNASVDGKDERSLSDALRRIFNGVYEAAGEARS
jgi:hypothetical protein